MEMGSVVLEDIVFRGVEFNVKIEVEKGLLIVEISDSMTADQWRGEFDPACKWHITGISKRFSMGINRHTLTTPFFCRH